MRQSSVAAVILTAVVPGCSDPLAVSTRPEADGPMAETAPPGLMLPSTIEALLALEAGPVVIAHRGMGPNRGEDPLRPIENSLAALRAGFAAGAPVVELDLALTSDGKVVAWHEDFLDDLTCFSTMTADELLAREPHIATLESLLQNARRANRASPDRLSGLVTVELKPPSPLCDPLDEGEDELVDAVIGTIRRMHASDIVFFNSMSPVMLALAADRAPEIPRQLTLLVLQFLSPQQIEAALGLPVTLIDKAPEFGLQWAELGTVHRLPGYAEPAQALATAHAVGATIVSFDLRLLAQLEQLQAGAASMLVAVAKQSGLHAFGGDVVDAQQWMFGAALGLDALYADDVPLAVSLQPPLD